MSRQCQIQLTEFDHSIAFRDLPAEISKSSNGPVSGLRLFGKISRPLSEQVKVFKRPAITFVIDRRTSLSPFTVAGAVPDFHRLPDYPYYLIQVDGTKTGIAPKRRQIGHHKRLTT